VSVPIEVYRAIVCIFRSRIVCLVLSRLGVKRSMSVFGFVLRGETA
jgi:hypothetical protein